ncbi:MAG: hypothetical protein SGBAC_008918 [Bacillariaceae sp.]
MSEPPKRTDICLPSAKHVVLTWKVKLGSHVQKGETIVIACLETDAEAARQKIASTTPASTISTHKRPKRGRRLIPSAASMATAKAAKPLKMKPTDSTTTQSLHQKLAERLAKSIPSAPAENKTSDRALDSAAATTESPKAAASPTSTAALHQAVVLTPILSPAKGFAHESNDAATNGVVGYIEECLHPAFVGGLCVVCGTPKSEIDENDTVLSSHSSPLTGNSDRRQQNTLVTVSGGITVSISQQESQQMAKLDTERLSGMKKLCLVLDLDHTLLHATADPRAQPFSESNDDVRTLRLPIVMEAQPNGQKQPSQQPVFMTHYVKLRPHLKEFLDSMRDTYEISVYTAGTRQYAEEITIILSRHLVGTKLDMLGLEKLRYSTFIAQQDYETQLRLEKKRKSDSNGGAEGDADEKQAIKRKKVSFGVDEVKTYDTASSAAADAPVEKKTATLLKAKLDKLSAELARAEEMEKEAQKLRQSVFGSRVVSRTDVGDLGRDVKSLRRIFPCGGTMAAVVDDREDVWANASDNSETTRKGEPPSNLLLVKPYHFPAFQGFADVNNAAGVDLSGSTESTETEEKDMQLKWTGQILKDLHALYYSQQNGTRQTVPELLSRMRKNVLKGTNLVLSGLVAINRDMSPNAPRPSIVRFAESLGAQLQSNVDVSVTHVVAAKDGTDKAIAARKFPRTVLIKPSWLMECYWSMSRRRSLAHLMTPIPSRPTSPIPERKPAVASEPAVESSDDEDDLAAALEEEMMND